MLDQLCFLLEQWEGRKDPIKAAPSGTASDVDLLRGQFAKNDINMDLSYLYLNFLNEMDKIRMQSKKRQKRKQKENKRG